MRDPNERTRSEIARVTALVAASAVLGAILGAITGEKTTFLYKDVLHLSASAVTTLNLLLALPAYLQPFIGAWTDVMPWLGYHRRSYYVLGTLIGILGFAPMALMPRYHLAPVVALLLASGSGSVLSAVVFNAVIVAVGNRTGTFGRLQSLGMFLPLVLGVIYTSHLGGAVAEHWSYQRAYGTAALLALLYLPLVLLMDDLGRERALTAEDDERARAERKQAERTRTKAVLREALGERGFWVYIAFVAYIALTPSPDTAKPFYQTDALHFSKQFIGDLGMFISAGTLAGLLAFAAASRRLQVRALAWGVVLMNCMAYLCYLGMHDSVSAKITNFLWGFCGAVAGLCGLTLAARACPEGIEATIWGLIGSVATFFYLWCDKWGTWLYDYYGPTNKAHHYTVAHGWYTSVAIGLGVALFAVVFVPFLPGWARSKEALQAARPRSPEEADSSAPEDLGA